MNIRKPEPPSGSSNVSPNPISIQPKRHYSVFTKNGWMTLLKSPILDGWVSRCSPGHHRPIRFPRLSCTYRWTALRNTLSVEALHSRSEPHHMTVLWRNY